MKNSTEYEHLKTASIFILAPIVLIGIVCNTLAIFVFRRKNLKKYSYSFYWKHLAWFENLLLVYIFRHWLRRFPKIDPDVISPFFCHINEYISYTSGTVAICLESFITLDRFFTIIYGKKLNLFKQTSFRIISLFLIVVYCLLLNINIPLNYQLTADSNGTWVCQAHPQDLKLHSIFHVINVLVFNLLINTSIDLRMIYHIIKTRRNLRLLNRSSLIDRQFAISAISINLTSLILKLPFFIGNFLGLYFGLDAAIFEIMYMLFIDIALLDKIDMLFINLLVNSAFRQEFFSMIGLKCKSSGKNSGSNLISRRALEIVSSPQETILSLKGENNIRLSIVGCDETEESI